MPPDSILFYSIGLQSDIYIMESSNLILYCDFSDIPQVRKIGVKIRMSILIIKMC